MRKNPNTGEIDEALERSIQHSNADYDTGPLRRVIATAEMHRFHHHRGEQGDINFALFFPAWALGAVVATAEAELREIRTERDKTSQREGFDAQRRNLERV